ncbi:MAG: hypothetical protein HZB37_08430 [Planctomycetes bacterium]|nr:hypothetical protein [Planctomycetota bacterium]
MTTTRKEREFALCIRNEGCDDLELHKVYQVIPDVRSAKDGYLRIVDESGEDYLYPELYFVFVKLPRKTQEAIQVAV